MIGDLNISHLYRGLLERNRAFASFKKEELDIIYTDISKYLSHDDIILDPMSGYGGTMTYFGEKGHKTVNVELNPPAYYWQILINPQNTNKIIKIIDKLLEMDDLPEINDKFSLTTELFSGTALEHIKNLTLLILNISDNQLLAIAIVLPFVSRFANYMKSQTNITHFKQGGMCSYIGWEDDFKIYLNTLKQRLTNDYKNYKQIHHKNVLSDLLQVNYTNRFSFFVTSPPYPNYRDYSKLFKIENYILDKALLERPTDFSMMIGSNNVRGKEYGEIHSEKVNFFLNELQEKANKLNQKAKSDIKSYYYPYFAQYFYNIQKAYMKLHTILTRNSLGYIVVNDNITRDIIVPVGESIRDIFHNMGYETIDLDVSPINHYGNIRHSAKRINAKHTRHIIKIWKTK